MDAIDAANGELHCTVANTGVLGNKKGNQSAKNNVPTMLLLNKKS